MQSSTLASTQLTDNSLSSLADFACNKQSLFLVIGFSTVSARFMAQYAGNRGKGIHGMQGTEYAVIGGGLVGMSIAYGLQRRGRQVTVFDEADDAFRASRGNFGLIWVQGKGAAMADYARWTRLSASLWPQLRDDLTGASGLDLELSQSGGLDVFINEAEAQQGIARLSQLRDALDGDYPFEYLEHDAVKAYLPRIGPGVVGATYLPEDGHTNPLYLLQALHRVFAHQGGVLINGTSIDRIEPQAAGFHIIGTDNHFAQKVVLCAGLGNAKLAPMVGLNAPVKPNRGQVLVTERMRPFMQYPTVQIRQVGEGAVQIGDSKEDVGFDDSTAPDVVARIAKRAITVFPLLEQAKIVRSWAALRVMSSDGHPVYDKSEQCPGASLVTCHSGVTLAAVHALVLAGWIDSHEGPDYMENFSARRFDATPSA